MKWVVVTGATSMLGLALIEECVKAQVSVLAIVHKNSKKKYKIPDSPLVKILECDLGELAHAKTDESGYDVFFHFAWGFTDRTTRDDPRLQMKNIEYTLDAIELAHRLGCKKFLFAGSQAEYGVITDVISADSPVNPQVCYGMAKYAAGKLGRKLCESYDMIHIWCRIFSVYGKNDSPNVMISYAIRQFENGEKACFSSGTQMWNYLFETDAGRIFYLLGEKCGQSKLYCVANPESKRLRDYIREMKEALGEGFEYELSTEPAGKNGVSLNVDVGSLYEEIGYEPKISFKKGIQEMEEYRKLLRGGWRRSRLKNRAYHTKLEERRCAA